MAQPFFPLAVVLVAVSVAAWTDLWKFKIHNTLTLPMLAAGLIFHGVVGGPPGLLESFLGTLFGFGILIVFYAMGGMGGGDVKLMAAIGAWLGIQLTFYVFLASALIGGIAALILIVYCGRGRETWVNLQIIWHRVSAFGRHLGADDRVEAEVNRADRRRRVIPFAAMIALGLVALLVWSVVLGTH